MQKNLLLAFLSLCISLHAQQWAVKLGGAQVDQGTALGYNQNGNIYATGYFSANASFGTTTLTSAGSYDGYLVKCDTSGNIAWAIRFGGGGSEYPWALAVDNNGDIIVTGTFDTYSIQIGTQTYTTNNNFYNSFIAKFNPSGNVIWAIASEGKAEIKDIAIDSQNNINLIGTISNSCIFGQDTITPYYFGQLGGQFNSRDIVVAKYSSAGTLSWVKRAGGYGDDFGNSITVDSNDQIYITGSIDSAAYFDNILKNVLNNIYYKYDAYVAKLNTNGNYAWVKTFAGPNSITVGQKIKVANNKLYFAGQFESNVALGQTTLTGLWQTFVSRCDTAMNFLWTKKAGGKWITGMDVDAGDNILFSGFYTTNDAIFGMDTLKPNGDENIYVSKMNSAGSFMWSKQAGGKYYDRSFSLCLDQKGNAYISGNYEDTAKFGALTLISDLYYIDDAFIAKYNFSGQAVGMVENRMALRSNILLYPNPGNEYLHVEADETIAFLEIFSLTGESVSHIESNQSKVVIPLFHLANGMYILRVTFKSQRISNIKFAVKNTF